MVDFSASFQRGLEAARQAQANRQLVVATFAKLNEALSAGSNGLAEIAIVEQTEVATSLAKLAAVFAELPARYQALVVRHRVHADFRPREIARWKQDQNGFPCMIITADRQASCDGTEALEQELAALFASPRVGEAIFAAMSFESKTLPVSKLP